MFIDKKQIIDRIHSDNSWWQENSIEIFFKKMSKRPYFDIFYPLVIEKEIKRAVVLMGPRRVGKTVMINHTIQKLIDEGIESNKICYFSIDTPTYSKIPLESLLIYFLEINKLNKNDDLYIFFDEIQYLNNWELHLKSLVDTYHNIKFIVSGSSAAALKLKSIESGAGRFTDFILPPLSFYEYLVLRYENSKEAIFWNENIEKNIDKLNSEFLYFINFGGYPEVSISKIAQENINRYLKNDIIEKVLLKDLPNLYGVQDIQELNVLFNYIAYNTGLEFSLDAIASNSGVAKNTIKKYLQYLEAAFLIHIVHRIDQNSKKFKKANFFKVYLTNTSLRSALFMSANKEDKNFGNIVESAIYAQYYHQRYILKNIYYARWNEGEVDVVILDPIYQKPYFALEIKWSNRFAEDPKQLRKILNFCNKNNIKTLHVTTIDILKEEYFGDILIKFIPAAILALIESSVAFKIQRDTSNLSIDELMKQLNDKI
ncbi:MAG: ATP-binding protein [Sphingobacteriales bacterium]|jgi:hypothetical protein|nr:MAG: ATP-binding protein [Sphingobacteriales bacterium]